MSSEDTSGNESDGRRTKWTRDALIEEIHRLADEMGRTPTYNSVNDIGRCSTGPFESVFGTWNNALEAAGYGPNNRINIPEEDIIDDLLSVRDTLGRTPSREEYSDLGNFAPPVFSNRFGSWNAALEEIGLELVRERNIPDDRLISELKRVGDVVGGTPTETQMNDMGRYSDMVYHDRFGSWNEAIQAAGFDPNVEYGFPDQELLDDILRLNEELGRVPMQKDIEEQGRFGVASYHRRFESWINALEMVGLEWEWEYPTGPDHWFYEGGYRHYGPGWNRKKRERVRERDGRQCVQCGRTEEEHIRKYNRKHAVHHIMKARNVDDPEERNGMDNLVTLCVGKDCHHKWEKMSPLRPEVV